PGRPERRSAHRLLLVLLLSQRPHEHPGTQSEPVAPPATPRGPGKDAVGPDVLRPLPAQPATPAAAKARALPVRRGLARFRDRSGCLHLLAGSARNVTRGLREARARRSG